METTKYEAIVKLAEAFTDEEVTQCVGELMKAHSLVINPQIVINVQKINPQVGTFKDDVKKETN